MNQRFCCVITKPPHIELLRSISAQLGCASWRDSLEHFLNCYLAGDAPISQIPVNAKQALTLDRMGRMQVYLKKPAHLELLRSIAATQLGTTSLKDGLEYILTRYLMGNAPIKQIPSNVEQVPVKPESVAASPSKKVTRRFGTPKDRQSIENLKRIYLLDQMGFYSPCWPYFEPTSQAVIFYFHNDNGKDNFNPDHPEKLPPVVMLRELWEIPADYPFFSDLTYIRWDWEIDEHKSNEQLKEALECLKSLDEILIRPVEDEYETTIFDESAWERRICGFFRGDFEEILTPTQEGLILDFIESSMAVASKELDKFYVPFVEIPLRTV